MLDSWIFSSDQRGDEACQLEVALPPTSRWSHNKTSLR